MTDIVQNYADLLHTKAPKLQYDSAEEKYYPIIYSSTLLYVQDVCTSWQGRRSDLKGLKVVNVILTAFQST